MGEREGGLNRDGGLINFPPVKRGAYLRGGGLNRGFTVVVFHNSLHVQTSTLVHLF